MTIQPGVNMSPTNLGGESDKKHRLLAVFAHPDDETFLAGPLLAKYAAEGVLVELLCAAPSGSVARRRQLREAASVLGIGRIHLLDYEPSHMWPERNEPTNPLFSEDASPSVQHRARCTLGDDSPYELVAAIGAILQSFQPDVMLVDSQYGSYGHPDHVYVHRAAVRAFADRARPGSKLYALAFPRLLVRLHLLLLAGIRRGNPRVGPNGKIDLAQVMVNPPKSSARIDVSKFIVKRRLAAQAYAAEIDAAPLPLKMLERSPLWLQKLFLGRATLTRISPPPDTFERGLFRHVIQ